MFQDTIVAIATALQQGPIAIVRMSGPDAIEIASTLLHKDLHQQASHTITYGFIRDPKNGEKVDEVLVSLFKAPKTYTGEDMVEINCHGGSYITKEILRLCLENGARMANPGEFSQRGYLNGKMDLTKAEGIHDMVFAQDKNNARMAIQAIQGSVVKVMDPLLEKLLDIIANIEVNIDYDKIKEDEKWDGLKGYITNTKLTPKTVSEEYSGLWQVERAFRISKGTLELRPMFHFTKKRIEAHVCICFVAYKVYKELERILTVTDIKLSVDKVLDIAKTITTISFQMPHGGESITKTMLLTDKHKMIGQLFEPDFWDDIASRIE